MSELGFAETVMLVTVLLVAVQRIAEAIYGERNKRALIATGAHEIGARHFPLFFVVHGGWLIALLVWAFQQPVQLSWPLLGLFVLLQMARLWVLSTLGRFWTTRIIVVPDAPMISSGPYRFTRHPNYVVVVLEIAVLPLAFGAWQIALLFSLMNAALLAHRIRLEDQANEKRRDK